MTPPRPTVHQLKSLDAKFLKVIEHINKLTQGDTLAGDEMKLGRLRQIRAATEVQRREVAALIGKEKP